MKFEYKLHQGYLQPIINITITGPRGSKEGIKVLVDSGATYSIFPKSYAIEIGLNYEQLMSQQTVFGCGPVPGRRGTITYNIRGYQFNDHAVFVDSLAFEKQFSLLGRRLIFSKFNAVVFNEKVNHPYVYLDRRQL